MSKKKTVEQLRAAYIKSNKARRERIANLAGFPNGNAYLKHLEGQIASREDRDYDSPKKVVHVINILDVSTSMGSIFSRSSKCSKAFAGIKSEIKELLLDKENNYTFSLVAFAGHHQIQTLYWRANNHIETDILQGVTALNDALYQTYQRVITDPHIDLNSDHERVLISVFTDGGENNSQVATTKDVKKVAALLNEKGVTITFVGTAVDVLHAQMAYNIDASNTLVHDNTSLGVAHSFSVRTSATKQYAGKVSKGATKEETLVGYFKEEGTL